MKEKLTVIGEFLLDQFKIELDGQDHKASGDLERSLRYEILETATGFEIVFYGLDYGKDLETGTEPHFVPIDALIRWIEHKGLAHGEKAVKGMAFAVQKSILQDGTPTKGSWANVETKNGRKIQWITFVSENSKVYVSEQILKAMALTTSITLANLIKQTNNKMA